MLTTVILITAIAAIPTPKYTIDDVVLTESEAIWLLSHRGEYERGLLRKAQALSTAIAETTAEIEELTAERDAMPQGTERDAATAQITAIESGAKERGKVAIKTIKKSGLQRPTPADARRETLTAIYNYDGDVIRGNTDSNETLSRAETGFPAWLYNLIDSNADAELSAAEIRAYWDSL